MLQNRKKRNAVILGARDNNKSIERGLALKFDSEYCCTFLPPRQREAHTSQQLSFASGSHYYLLAVHHCVYGVVLSQESLPSQERWVSASYNLNIIYKIPLLHS